MHKVNYTILCGADLPLELREIPSPPRRLFVVGDGRCLFADWKIAVVGTRRPTAEGLAIARRLGGDLARGGAVVVSGLAFGIDQAAHRGCLAAGGRTIAVLASGWDNVYPRQHQALAESILQKGGAIVSEYDAGTPALRHQFLERNRIISGLCRGVAIVEAPFKSGALNTAAHAVRQNREVFVAPGPAAGSNYAGSHKLIQEGAALITAAKDIFDCFGISAPIVGKKILAGLVEEQKRIIEALNKAPLNADQIADLISLDIAVVNQHLTNLLVEGFIAESGGKYFVS